MLRISTALAVLLALSSGAVALGAQERLFPPRHLIPGLLAGPRDPATSATMLGVVRNPNAHESGVELEASIGSTLPVLLLSSPGADDPVVVGIEAAVFARFGLQILERELIATDWVFSVPVIWHHESGWTRFRFYHTSSHMGDEYNRRFEDPGVNFSRDAAEILTFRRFHKGLGMWAGVRYGYNVHPQEHERWVLRGGGQLEADPSSGTSPYFLATDLEWEQSPGWEPRVEIRVGRWLSDIEGRRVLTVSLSLLSGPSPLGQFHGFSTTQFGLTLQKAF